MLRVHSVDCNWDTTVFQVRNCTECLLAGSRTHHSPLYSRVSTHLPDALHNRCCSERPPLLQHSQASCSIRHHPTQAENTSPQHPTRSAPPSAAASATFLTRTGQGRRESTVADNDQLLASGERTSRATLCSKKNQSEFQKSHGEFHYHTILICAWPQCDTCLLII